MRKVRRRFSGRTLGVMLLGVGLVFSATACGSSSSTSAKKTGSSGGSIVIGSKNFAGAQIISQLYGQAIQAKGLSVSYKDNIGPTETVFPLLKKGDIELYGEYQGTALTYLHGNPTGNAQQTFTLLSKKLAGTGVVALGPASARDVNGFYVLKSTADKYHLTTISSLKPVADKLVFGGTPECLDRPLCLGTTEQQLYGLNFKSVLKLDEGGPITNSDLDNGTIDVGLLFTGSSVIKPDYVLLTDDKGLQPADDPVALVRTSSDTATVRSAVKGVNDKLDTAAYNEMALKVFNDKEDPSTVARAWLQKVGILAN